jgi:uncharacterized DUF497 family protein
MGCRQLDEDLGPAPGDADRMRGAFLNHPLVVASDEKHSAGEERFYALGQTESGRLMFVVFTVRGRLIRVISARDMNRKERRVYRSS